MLLEGNTVVDTIKSWNVLNHVTLAPDSEMEGLLTYKQHEASLIDTLDGQQGPFDTFNDWKETVPASATSTMTTMGIPSTTALTGYAAGTPNTITVDLSQAYNNTNVPSNLDNVGFSIPSYMRYVLTTDTSRNYKNIDGEINIASCTSLADVAKAIAARSYYGVKATASGMTVTFTTYIHDIEHGCVDEQHNCSRLHGSSKYRAGRRKPSNRCNTGITCRICDERAWWNQTIWRH